MFSPQVDRLMKSSEARNITYGENINIFLLLELWCANVAFPV